MVGDSVITLINIVTYISLNAYYRQSPKCKMIFLVIAVGLVVYSLCSFPFKKVIDQANTDCILFINGDNLRVYCTDLEFSSVLLTDSRRTCIWWMMYIQHLDLHLALKVSDMKCVKRCVRRLPRNVRYTK